jgi:hypothetical protein
MVDFQAEVARFRGCVQELREQYLNEIVDLTLTDVRLSEVQRVLDLFQPTQEKVTVIPEPERTAPVPTSTQVTPGTMATLAPPDKQPLKSYRVSVFGHCPACNGPLFEAQARYCSQCAYPLQE